ncbi:MAG: glycoside hydrolase family 13 protein [Clostridia bacterium]|nr:glycoside hydrolase family 13 protein [Clostridia bacterium]
MQIYHNSQNEKFRTPLGAAETESKIKLSIFVKTNKVPERVMTRLWNGTESFVPMSISETVEDGFWYSCEIGAPDVPGLLWYYFVVESNGATVYYSNNPQRLGGEGVMEYSPSDISYQITVYDKAFKTPDWFKNAIMYQIFPDRFFKMGEKEDFPERKSGYKIHKDWYEDFYFDQHPYENGPACNDFYGGNLKGIMSKLDYLKDLGISVIYLNPIFESYSNHRYDTGDYSKIDPILGDESDFKELCDEAMKKGIRIILDGVFSHTGSDSVYFNKYGNYGQHTGASRDYNSPYGKWYQWNQDGTYNSWWGCSNLPNVNEMEPTYIDYILKDNDAIIKKWLRLGASGWRLDVADELPDEFIKILRREAKSEKGDTVVIGEVWEDASNKVSYSKQREYLYGDELDSVMNYPFKDGVLAFLTGGVSATDFAKKMLSIMENYPKEALYTTMNLIGTHDTVRIKTLLGGQHIDGDMSLYDRQNYHLNAQNETMAINRLRLAAFMQMTFVGVPCIYYGDEIGMQGLADPFNRRPYTWRCVDVGLFDWYKKITKLRNETDCLRTGDFEVLYAKDDVLIYKREIRNKMDVFGNKSENGTAICCINRGCEKRVVEFAFPANIKKELTGQFGGKKLSGRVGVAKIELAGYEAEVFMG